MSVSRMVKEDGVSDETDWVNSAQSIACTGLCAGTWAHISTAIERANWEIFFIFLLAFYLTAQVTHLTQDPNVPGHETLYSWK